MTLVLIFVLVLALAGAVAFIVLREQEQRRRIGGLERQLTEAETRVAALARFEHIPDIIEKSKRVKDEIASKMDAAEKQAESTREEGREQARRLVAEAQEQARRLVAETKEQARRLRESSENEAKTASDTIKAEIKIKTAKAVELLDNSTVLAQEIVEKAEKRAAEIGGKAYEALKRAEFYEKTADAMFNVTKGYGNRYMVSSESVLDAWAEEYGFHKVGEKLKAARERTRIMEKNRTAATCDYAEAGRRETAINFVVDAFNGKVDSILSRVKKDNVGTLRKEIADAFAMVNFNGKAFKDARINQEFLDARLDELKWAADLQRLREKDREEQRAIREKIRDEEKARRDYERAIKQAKRDEDMLKKAMDELQLKFKTASLEDQKKYEERLADLSAKLTEAEERNKRAVSMAQQTKRGNVYVISNVGSFGEDVYKVGLTRRLDPLERVKELGDASVPFGFDVHAMIDAEDAPALEHELHKLFVQQQVNKVNPRKEFFRIQLADIRQAVEQRGFKVAWTLAAEARDYRETLALEEAIKADPAFHKRWVDRQRELELQIEKEEALGLDEDALALAEESD